MRSYSARRVRQALLESLRKAGYASDGSRLPGTEGRASLYGTLVLGALPSILKTKRDVLLQQTDSVVAYMLRMQFGDRRVKFSGNKNTGGGKAWKGGGHWPQQETQSNKPSYRSLRM